jgi:hypothetical protein
MLVAMLLALLVDLASCCIAKHATGGSCACCVVMEEASARNLPDRPGPRLGAVGATAVHVAPHGSL